MSDVFDLLTKFPVLIGIIIGTFSTVVGSILALITTIITNCSQRRREREQWVREKLQEIYSNCISSLTAWHGSGLPNYEEFPNAVKWLNILLIYHSNISNKDFLTFPEEISLFSSQNWKLLAEKYNNMGLDYNANFIGEPLAATKGLMNRVIKLASVDKRLHG
ncbi:hypothetical protein FACHB389_08165 [Nostoc calcicola FACHB-389]|nr:hypothetical protein [Nostoc calcicola FACHB-3891]OKH39213.1 hypothetical protein FACHB389_08165 [Nostoc calcicola FACHB-389]